MKLPRDHFGRPCSVVGRRRCNVVAAGAGERCFGERTAAMNRPANKRRVDGRQKRKRSPNDRTDGER